jgi:hypothetical protein
VTAFEPWRVTKAHPTGPLVAQLLTVASGSQCQSLVLAFNKTNDQNPV